MHTLTVAKNGVLEDPAWRVMASKKPGDTINLFVYAWKGKEWIVDTRVTRRDKMIHYTLTQRDIDKAESTLQEIREWHATYGISEEQFSALCNVVKKYPPANP